MLVTLTSLVGAMKSAMESPLGDPQGTSASALFGDAVQVFIRGTVRTLFLAPASSATVQPAFLLGAAVRFAPVPAFFSRRARFFLALLGPERRLLFTGAVLAFFLGAAFFLAEPVLRVFGGAPRAFFFAVARGGPGLLPFAWQAA